MKLYAIKASNSKAATEAVQLLGKYNVVLNTNYITGNCKSLSAYYVANCKLHCVAVDRVPKNMTLVTPERYKAVISNRTKAKPKEASKPEMYTAIFGNFEFSTSPDTCKVLTLEHVQALPEPEALEQVCESLISNNLYDSYIILEEYAGKINWNELRPKVVEDESVVEEACEPVENTKWSINMQASDRRVDTLVARILKQMGVVLAAGCSSFNMDLFMASNEEPKIIEHLRNNGLSCTSKIQGGPQENGLKKVTIFCYVPYTTNGRD